MTHNKSKFRSLTVVILSTAMLLWPSMGALAQDDSAPRPLKFGVEPPESFDIEAVQRDSNQAKGLKVWPYAISSTRKGSKGSSYNGFMVGNSPFDTNTTTTTTVYVVPLIIQIGSTTFDPTKPDPCIGGKVPLTVLKNSPMVKATHDFTVNGVDMGKTQYSDAFQRSNFWGAVSGLGGTYHNKLNYKFLAPLTINPGSDTNLYNTGNPCSPKYGGIDKGAFGLITGLALLPYAQSLGASPTSLPLFLLYNTTIYNTTPDKCCIGGYHGATGSPVQTYAVVGFDTEGFYGANATDTLIMSHEINEWQDDPFGNNLTPAWGHVGQVSGCQGNLEVGDPLTPINRPTVTMNGYTYHLQELAYFNWFYGGPSIGAGGKFSDNGTFTSAQGSCK